MNSELRALFALPDFRRLVATRIITSLALPALSVAIGWNIYDLTHDPVYLGYVGLTLFLPQAFLILPAGHAADRYDRRSLMLISYGVMALAALLYTALAWYGVPSVLPYFAVMLLQASGYSLMRPASQSLLPRVVPREHLATAVAFSTASFQMATIVGPAFGGLLYGFGAITVYGVVAGLLLTLLAILAGLAKQPPTAMGGNSVLENLLGGVNFVRARPVLLGAISLDLFAVLLGGATALLPVYARDILQVGPTGLGLLRSASAFGGLCCGLYLSHHKLTRGAGRTMFLCVAAFGVATIVFGLSRNLPLSLAALMFLGATDMVSVYVRQTLVQINTPDEMRGRVSAVSSLFIGASNELGEFESGITAAMFGTVPAVVGGGIGTLLIVLLWSLMFPQLRKVDRLDQ